MFTIIGTTTLDVFTFCDKLWPQSGNDGTKSNHLLFCDQPQAVRLGGNGGCAAYVLAGLGAPVSLCSAVGQDQPGQMLLNWLKSRKVNLTGVFQSRERATSSSTIIKTGNNRNVFHHLGATADINLTNIPQLILKQPGVLLVTGLPLLVSMSIADVARALSVARAAGSITAIDIGPALERSASIDELTPLLPFVDYLIANRHELVACTGESHWKTATAQLFYAGVKNVVIKRGERGVLARGSTGVADAPSFAVEADISVGAGDSFNVGFLYAIRQKRSLADALRYGNAVAALVMSAPRGVLDSPSSSAVEMFLKNNPA